MKIIAIRHAETNYNVLGLVNYDPSVDVHLTEQGEKQARELAEKLKGRSIDLIIVSEFKRTRQTADIINSHHDAEILVEPLLNDIRNGFEGRPVAEYHEARDNASDKLNTRFNDGESISDVNFRTRDFLAKLSARPEATILIVTSKHNLKQIRTIIEDLPAEAAVGMPMPNAAMFEFTI
ncbi:histidine phosphatase family protein [Candidatus Saccharibacteria bacterium]|nr:histidine phosphatase family protein [Candidatus Saccharibacteria bacterium]